MNIVTLTLNPAFDIHCRAERFLQGHENLAHISHRQAGGKGVNISRALSANGIENRALLILGEENSEEFEKALDGIQYRKITVHGRIRENITIHADSGEETRLSFPGFRAMPGLLESVCRMLEDLCGSDSVVTMTGRIPEGMDIREVKRMLKALNTRLVMDSRSFDLDDLREMKPWLIKPNQEEISQYLGMQIETMGQAAQQAQKLHGMGISNVMVSMGAEGAVLACNEGTFVARPPKRTVRSTIGAGDSMIAGFLAAMDAEAATRLKTAVAYGTAACMTEGTLPPEPVTVMEILTETEVKEI